MYLKVKLVEGGGARGGGGEEKKERGQEERGRGGQCNIYTMQVTKKFCFYRSLTFCLF